MADVWTVLSAGATAFAAGAAAVSGYYAYHQVDDARRVAEVQAIATLSSQASDLYAEFSRAGIDDVPRLTSHLYLMWVYRDRKVITDEFYVLQARTWCSLTRPASDKLRIYWQDSQSFRNAYVQSQDFLKLLDALDDKSTVAKKECL